MDFGFPSGAGLVNQIVKGVRFATQGDERVPLTELARRLAEGGAEPGTLARFVAELNRSQTYSVDAFLESHSEFGGVGKLAIAAALAPEEKDGQLFTQSDTWYRYLTNRLRDNIISGADGELAILTYNYERSLEHYLYVSLKSALNKCDSEMDELFLRLKIVHLHGSLGQLPRQTAQPEGLLAGLSRDVARKYGETEDIQKAAANIQIIHESLDESPAYQSARHVLERADRVLFLGFGFHRTNVRRLLASGWIERGAREICGTAFKHSAAEISQFHTLLKGRAHLHDLNCLEFLRAFPHLVT
jgi:hypothetical protein